MDILIFRNGLYQLVPLTPELLVGESFQDCFDFCNKIREKLAIYQEEVNVYVLENGAFFFGCMCN
jgi:hypothetical protein|tara:strand:+ start:1212 stop:1406 length:195 start_codon:yes stop_codon:yes gene_type:complete